MSESGRESLFSDLFDAAESVLYRVEQRSLATCKGGAKGCETCVGSCGVEEWRDLREAVDAVKRNQGVSDV